LLLVKLGVVVGFGATMATNHSITYCIAFQTSHESQKKRSFVSIFKHLSHAISIICLSPSHVPQQQRKLSTSNFRAPMEQRGVSHYGLAIYIKKISLRQKKNYENSNISPCKNYITFKKNPLKQTKIL
jgi:hypothetical protein